VPLVDVPAYLVVQWPSPEFPSRAAASSARAAATPPLSLPLPALPPRAPCLGVLRVLTRAPEPKIELAGELRRRPPPAAAIGRHVPPPASPACRRN
jgi:hypothetical protein